VLVTHRNVRYCST